MFVVSNLFCLKCSVLSLTITSQLTPKFFFFNFGLFELNAIERITILFIFMYYIACLIVVKILPFLFIYLINKGTDTRQTKLYATNFSFRFSEENPISALKIKGPYCQRIQKKKRNNKQINI